MFPNYLDGLAPDRGPAPAYRLAPDTPADIATDLARLCTPAASAPKPNDARDLAQGTAIAASASPSRRLTLFGAAAALLAPMAPRPAAARGAVPVGPLILAQAEAVDFAAVWASLSPETQARIGALAIEAETFDQLGQDGGFHTTAGDRDAAEARANEVAHTALPAAIWAALPGMLPTVYDEPYPLWQALGGRELPASVDVWGFGLCPLLKEGGLWCARVGVELVALGGAVDLDNRDNDTPPRWQFWTAADIDAERLRRHPEMAEVSA